MGWVQDCPNCGKEMTFENIDVGVGVVGHGYCHGCHWPQETKSKITNENEDFLQSAKRARVMSNTVTCAKCKSMCEAEYYCPSCDISLRTENKRLKEQFQRAVDLQRKVSSIRDDEPNDVYVSAVLELIDFLKSIEGEDND